MAERLITVTSYGRMAGSARVRVFDWLADLGLRSEPQTYLDTSTNSPRDLLMHPLAVARAESRLRRLSRSVGGRTLLLSRQASPLSRGGVEEALLRRAKWSAYDVDDALHVLDRGTFAKARIWRRAAAAAGVVIAGNDILADAASTVSRNVVVVPSCVEPDDYRRKSDYSQSETPRAVWIGSPATEQYLSSLAPALLRVHRSHGLRLTLISAGDRGLGELDQMVDRIAWSPDGFATALSGADVGIMPLPDNPWTRGKCGYKLLQYSAAALPIVASPVGVNREIIAGASGLAASSVDDWAGALQQIIDEPEAARRMRGEAGLRMVRDHYSFAAWRDVWRRAVGLT
ncbi:glycosyltransferase [Microbacterium sp. Root180]|uniref:glycosyltransferase n=1 Tax=Microbacterium sp. Root180 TaxID=1736483 RepID=UPI0006F92093|nr:glycosyltransferase [Microbacterium sp. Root180]KRB36250.1 hypothetical protein ASD93_09130 [Microbacterium sp. Root180]